MLSGELKQILDDTKRFTQVITLSNEPRRLVTKHPQLDSAVVHWAQSEYK